MCCEYQSTHLARKGSFASSFFELAMEPVRLVLADCSAMSGGHKVVKIHLQFQVVARTRSQPATRGDDPHLSLCARIYCRHGIQYDLVVSLASRQPHMDDLPYACLFRESPSGDELILEHVAVCSGLQPQKVGGKAASRAHPVLVHCMFRASDLSGSRHILLIGRPSLLRLATFGPH